MKKIIFIINDLKTIIYSFNIFLVSFLMNLVIDKDKVSFLWNYMSYFLYNNKSNFI
jgi:hypothetical protein